MIDGRSMHDPHDAPDPLRPLALELRHLRLVVAIHDHGGVTRAGHRLHLSQSALSHQLHEIEERLGVQLFRRVRKKLVLSEPGERLLEAARRILRDVVAVEDEIRDHVSERCGTIRVTTECSTVYDWLPPLLKRFGRLHPRVRVQIVADATPRPIEALLGGQVDLALVTRVVERAELRVDPLFADELMLITSADHPLASRPHVRPADLANETLILYTPPSASHFYGQFFGGSGHAPREVVQVQLTEAMLSMIRAGLGVGVMTRWALLSDRRAFALVRLGPRGLAREWKAVTRSRDRRPRFVDDFVRLVVEAGPRDDESTVHLTRVG